MDYFTIEPLKAIVALNPDEARTIHVYDSQDIYKLRTTAIPSNHCPGSVMFLFEKLDCEVILPSDHDVSIIDLIIPRET